MAVTLVQQTGGFIRNIATGFSISFTTTPTNGNTLICCSFVNDSNQITSITGGGVTWHLSASLIDTTNTMSVGIWYGTPVSGGSTSITLNDTFNPNAEGMGVIAEFSGIVTTSPLDATGTSVTGNSSSINNSGTVTTTFANDLIVAMASDLSASYMSGPTNSFSILNNLIDTTGFETLTAYQIVSTTGNYSTTWTLGSGPAIDGCIAAFKAASVFSGEDESNFVLYQQHRKKSLQNVVIFN